ncbi:MAG: phosphodiesterase [Ruminococcaceae bacterium]|nr:phosphodiesterase [Oscillospiraceae bacterium]
MKIVIASDLHGSAHYCRMLIGRIHEEKPDRILLLGDILYHGPRNALPEEYSPPAVCDMLNPLANKIICVRGNCDGEVDGMVLKFPVLNPTALICDGDFIFTAVHGHHLDDNSVISPAEGDVVLYGHTHIPDDSVRNGVRYINPGSVSIPKENSPHSYIVYENGTFTHKDLMTGKAYRN